MWAFLVASRAMAWWNFSSDLNPYVRYKLEDIANTYKKVLPQYRDFICLTLMGSIIDFERDKEYLTKSQGADYLAQALKIILSEDINKIDRSNLANTRKWSIWSSQFKKDQEKEGIEDLLHTF